MKRILFSLLAVLSIFTVNAQNQRSCHANEVYHQQLQADPTLEQRRAEIEAFTNQFVAQYDFQAGERAVITIPVVFHIVYNTTAQNISDTYINAQLDQLNKDFRKLNADAGSVPSAFASLAADAEVQFCLAQQTPTGAATTGILRVSTTKTSFSTNDGVKSSTTGGSNAWDRNKYLNLWVCNLSGGVLGYAQFPGGAAATDGVVLGYSTVGSMATPNAAGGVFGKGRTATHEVGHWLNLFHIWGDDGTGCTGSDSVTDTPNQADENYGTPTFPQVSCSNGPNGDMFMNYMDYVDDNAMYMFSTGQKTRMQAVMATGGARASLATSTGCNAPTGGTTCGVPSAVSASSITASGATISWGTGTGATSYNVQYKTTAATTWTTVTSTGTSTTLTGLTASTAYNYQVQTVCAAGTSAYVAGTAFTTLAAGGGTCTDTYEANNTSATAKTIPMNTNITATISSSTDKDYFKFTTTNTTGKNVKVDLTGLPADYDMKLYRGNTLIGTSQNSGTADEQLINNTATTYTYTVYVYGYNGANSASCYTLRANVGSTAYRMESMTDAEISDFEAASEMTVYPNPVNGILNVRVSIETEEPTNIRLTDLAGRLVMQQRASLSKDTNQTQLDLSTLNNGMYILTVENNGNFYAKKVIVDNH